MVSSSVSLDTSRRRIGMPLALALCRASKSRAARSTSRAVGAYLHQQSMPWASVRAFSGASSSRRVPVRAVRCRARSVTKGAALLGGWRQLTLRGMHACSCECALERLPIRTVRHTVASHDLATYRLVRSGQHARGQRGAGTIVATA